MMSSDIRAVSPATGSVAACSSLIPSGRAARIFVSTAASSAHAPRLTSPTTRVPSGGPLPSAAARSTTPARSQPLTSPSSMSGRRRTSPRFSEKALTRTSASPGERLRLGNLAEVDVARRAR